MSAVLKNLREGTGFEKPVKLPASLKGMCPEQIVAILTQTYCTAVEQRGIAYIDITNAEGPLHPILPSANLRQLPTFCRSKYRGIADQMAQK